MSSLLSASDLVSSVNGKNVVDDLCLDISAGQVHAIMGPNGSGKSSLTLTLMGHPDYKIDSGQLLIEGESIVGLSPDKRAMRGLFLAIQNPPEIPGVAVQTFLREAYRASVGTSFDEETFSEVLKKNMELLGFKEDFLWRGVNEGFSGGERKRFEVLQLLLLKPKLAILDEIDSGVDTDSLKRIIDGIKKFRNDSPDSSILIITHYKTILESIEPDGVHILANGRIVASGQMDLVEAIVEGGFGGSEKNVG